MLTDRYSEKYVISKQWKTFGSTGLIFQDRGRWNNFVIQFWKFRFERGNWRNNYNLHIYIIEFLPTKPMSIFSSHSEVFNDGFRKKVIDGRMIKSLCLFRVWTLYICSCCKYIHAYRHKLHRGCNISLTDQKNIKPEWEDPANAGGCEFHATRTLTKENVDQLWENLVFAVIGSLLILYLWELYTYMK